MKITTDIKDNVLTRTKLIDNIEIIYGKKKIHNGALSAVRHEPFEVKILDDQCKDDPEHIIDFDLAQQITIKFFDGTLKTYQDEVE
ncbi:hypothetical protein B0A69_12770 [Chryseobacterium shigense]|uniref:Uncharacterized protein n=1 Tax=Chryseobacterium shigense TaxID=297244 RepID=A0A1N7HT00_9FLAO|nr:hypothetical protein [Chryseobacterium shigense]PQA93030.1 hypothetical protein B0A69_12770 [Chryseobacterium shigense]SIS27860.1 hypothetical protein SAMN05421639_1018 [Chryseobacterium shigense]